VEHVVTMGEMKKIRTKLYSENLLGRSRNRRKDNTKKRLKEK